MEGPVYQVSSCVCKQQHEGTGVGNGRKSSFLAERGARAEGATRRRNRSTMAWRFALLAAYMVFFGAAALWPRSSKPLQAGLRASMFTNSEVVWAAIKRLLTASGERAHLTSCRDGDRLKRGRAPDCVLGGGRFFISAGALSGISIARGAAYGAAGAGSSRSPLTGAIRATKQRDEEDRGLFRSQSFDISTASENTAGYGMVSVGHAGP